MAIAEHVVEGLAAMGLPLHLRHDFREIRMPPLGEASLRPYCDPERIAANPDYGRIVCHCERVSRGEIVDATHAPIPARSLDAARRRTRALLGRCQGFFCLAEVAALIASETEQSVEALLRVPPADRGGE
jgi:glycerol-3-phosphate dehydrogenase